MNTDDKFKGFHIMVSGQDGDYKVTFVSGLGQIRGSDGPQQMPTQPTATVKVRGDEMAVSWKHNPDKFAPEISREEFEEEAKRQVQEKRNST